MTPSPVGASYGAFQYGPLRIMSSGLAGGDNPFSMGWEHVSVSCANRCPTWDEMQFVKELFWEDSELVLQFHVPRKSHINIMKYCLHLWRRVGHEVELPTEIFV